MEEFDISSILKSFKSELPSENLSGYWIGHNSDKNYKRHTNYGGKWLIFSSKENIDGDWQKVKEAQDKGLLGDMSKVSTAINYKQFKNHVICVYTYDSNDKEDLLRVREGLKEAGFDKPINYKRDIETIKGVYGSNNEFLLTI